MLAAVWSGEHSLYSFFFFDLRLLLLVSALTQHYEHIYCRHRNFVHKLVCSPGVAEYNNYYGVYCSVQPGLLTTYQKAIAKFEQNTSVGRGGGWAVLLSPQNFSYGSILVDISQYPLAVRLAFIVIQKLTRIIPHTKMDKENILLLYKTLYKI